MKKYLLGGVVGFFILFLFLCALNEGLGIHAVHKSSVEAIEALLIENDVELRDVYTQRWIGKDRKVNIWVSTSRVEIQIDPNISGTAVDVSPYFSSHFLGSRDLTRAKKATIWVTTEEEKVKWDKWLAETIKSQQFQRQDEKGQVYRLIRPRS